MSSVRVIPVLLLHKGGLVKTEQFKKPVYLGDPINAVKIFNDKEVDELVLMDIDASIEKRPVNYDWLKDIVSESFMPLGYGGGISEVDHAKRLFDIGIEKIILNSHADNFSLIERLANTYGIQSIVASVDVRKNFFGNYQAYKTNGTTKIRTSLLQYTKDLTNAGVGEIILQSIDKEGTMKGYDLDLIKLVSHHVDVPVVASGGAGSLQDFSSAVQAGASAVSAGSLFVFKGSQRGILINYPTQENLNQLFREKGFSSE
jgi:cyclase